jgi:hypothetical protein
MTGWQINIQNLVEWKPRRETKVLGEHLHHSQLVHHKSHIIWYEIEPRPINETLELDVWNLVQIYKYTFPMKYSL